MNSSKGIRAGGNGHRGLDVSAERYAAGVVLGLPGGVASPSNGDGRSRGNGPGEAAAIAVIPRTDPRSSASASRRFEKTLTIVELAADLVTTFLCVGLLLPAFLTRTLAGHSGGVMSFAISAGVAVLFVLMLDREGAYRADNSLLRVRETERVLRASAETYVLMALSAAAYAGSGKAVTAVTVIALVAMVCTVAEKQLLYTAVRLLHTKGFGVRKVVIFGAGQTGRRVFSALARSPKLGLDPVAVVDDNPEKVGQRVFERSYWRQRSAPVVPGPVTRELLAGEDAEVLIVAIPSLTRERFVRIMEESSAAGTQVAFVPSTHVSSEFWVEHVHIDGLLLASVGGPAERVTYEVAKRAFDLLAGLLLLALVAPLWLVFWFLIRMDSPGPALFVQERVGKNGRLFKIFKFRTMFVGTPPYCCSPTSCSDPRITRIGRLLRRTSLDEVPQLLNVIRGEMSLVGPRPEMPFIVKQYLPRHRQRLHVKPGLTGLWQLSADRETLIHENLEYDLYYIRNRNFFMDMAILLHTMFFAMRGI